MEDRGLTLDEWRISPAEGTLRRDGATTRLEPRVMEVLVYLADHAGQVVTREALEHDVWRGALVGDDAVTSSIIKLRKALGDDARRPRMIVTVPKKGYMLVAPVHYTNDIRATLPPQQTEATATVVWNRTNATQLAIAVVGTFVVLLAALWVWRDNIPALTRSTGIPSVLVLPFENIGAHEEHDVFVDGMTDDIITDLSRVAGLFVLANNATFEYKGRTVTPQTLHEQLNVDFVVQGSVRRHGREIRINVQLVNAKTGFNLWAQRYDTTPDNVFVVQDQVANRLIEALSIRVTSLERERLAQRATSNLTAYDHFLDGQRISKQGTRLSNQLAAEAYRIAIKHDPSYGRAYGALAFVLAVDFRRGWTDTPVETLDRALALAEQGVALNTMIPQTHWSLGYVHLMRKEFDEAEEAAGQAIRIAPNYADGYGLLALINNSLGEPRKALEFAEKGMEINPYYTWDYLFNLGWAHYMLGNYAQAIDALERAQQRNESIVPVKLMLAATYVRADRREDAHWSVEQILILNPATTLSHTNNAISIAKPEVKQQLLNDLRIAGLPE